MEEYDASGTCTAQYIYAGVNKLASVKNNKLYFYHHDRLGSVIAVTDEEGQLEWQGEYFAYGKLKSESGNGDDWKFTGQEFDTESGFYNFKARYLDYGYEHFLTMDPILSDFSPYNYCYGNPANFVDYTGLLGTPGQYWDPNKRLFYLHSPNYIKVDGGSPYGPGGATIRIKKIIPIWNQISRDISNEWGEGIEVLGWYTYEVFETYNFPAFEETWAGGGYNSEAISIAKSGYGIGAAIYGAGSAVAKQIRSGNIRSYNPNLAIKSAHAVSKVGFGISIALYTSDLVHAYHQHGWNMFSEYEFWHPTAQFAGGIVGAVGGGFIGFGWVSVGSAFFFGQGGSLLGGWIVDRAYGR